MGGKQKPSSNRAEYSEPEHRGTAWFLSGIHRIGVLEVSPLSHPTLPHRVIVKRVEDDLYLGGSEPAKAKSNGRIATLPGNNFHFKNVCNMLPGDSQGRI